MAPHTPADVFDDRLDRWRAYQETPWSRVRYAVAAEILHRTCLTLGDGPLRVLDVGGGDGGDALPLLSAGHDVTVLDYADALLARTREAADQDGVAASLRTVSADLAALPDLDLGVFDLVLCHNVVHYLPATAPLVQTLAGSVAPRGALSLMAPNPASEVLTAVIRRQDLAEATALLTAETSRTVTFEHAVRRVTPEEAVQALAGSGFTMVSRYGLRAVIDFLVDDERKQDPEFYAGLEELELSLCDLEPFVRTARLWQLVARRPPLTGG